MLPKRNWKLREYFVTLSRFYKFIILMYFADTDDRRLLYHLTKFRLLLCWSSGGHHGTLTFSPHSEWSLNMAWRGRPSHLWRCSGHWVNEKRCWTQGCLWIPPGHLHSNMGANCLALTCSTNMTLAFQIFYWPVYHTNRFFRNHLRLEALFLL